LQAQDTPFPCHRNKHVFDERAASFSHVRTTVKRLSYYNLASKSSLRAETTSVLGLLNMYGQIAAGFAGTLSQLHMSEGLPA
jgi:hypothetical protein